jgi:hypothetical protein
MAYGVKPPHLAEWIVNLGEAAEYMFDHNIFQDNLVGVDFCEKMVRETNPACSSRRTHRGAARRSARLQDDRRHHARRSTRSPASSTARRCSEPLTREMFCLMEGATCTRRRSTRRRRHGADDPALHRLPDAADEVRRVHEARRAAARRPLRLLLRGAARLRGGRRPARPARLLGLVPEPARPATSATRPWRSGAATCS